MKQYSIRRQLTAIFALWAMLLLPLSAIAQTRVTMPKNKYKVQDDVKIGADASHQVQQQSPILNDRQTQAYGVNSLGLERKGFTAEQIRGIKTAFRLLLQSKLNTSQALEAIRKEGVSPEVQVLIDFIESSERGVIK